jgi:hypothetical protein
MGDKSCLSLAGTQSETHRWLPEHLTAEYPVTTRGRGRTVEEWKQRPDRPDNHGFDCLVGCSVGASMLGIQLATGTSKKSRERMTLARMAEIANRPTPQELKDLSARKQVTIPEWMKRK